jgi:hypothetical protein
MVSPAGKPPRKSPVSVRYPPALEDSLERHSEATGKPKAKILTEALAAYLGLPLADTVSPPGDRGFIEALETRIEDLTQRVSALESRPKAPARIPSTPRTVPTTAALVDLASLDLEAGLNGRDLSAVLGLEEDSVGKTWSKWKNNPSRFEAWTASHGDRRAWTRRGDKYYPLPIMSSPT